MDSIPPQNTLCTGAALLRWWRDLETVCTVVIWYWSCSIKVPANLIASDRITAELHIFRYETDNHSYGKLVL